MTEKVLVTGGAGFIGSHLTDKLIDAGYEVTIYDCLDEQVHGDLASHGAWPEFINPKAKTILGDIRDVEGLKNALYGIHYVVHLAACVGVGQSMYQIDKYTDVNCLGTARLLDVIVNNKNIRQSVKKILVASSMSNYGEGKFVCPEHGEVTPPLRSISQLANKQWELTCPIQLENGKYCGQILSPIATDESKLIQPNSVYAITKKTQEELVMNVGQAYGIKTVAMRFFNTYGPRQALSNPYTGVVAIFANRVLNNLSPSINEDGLQTRDFVYIDDLTQGIMIALEKSDSQVLNIGSGHPVTILDVANKVISALNKEMKPQITGQCRFGDIRHCYADISKLEALGYKPKYSLGQGIAKTLPWLKKQQTSTDQYETIDASLRMKGLSF